MGQAPQSLARAASLWTRSGSSPTTPVDLGAAFDDVVTLLAERNFDLYETPGDGTIRQTQ